MCRAYAVGRLINKRSIFVCCVIFTDILFLAQSSDFNIYMLKYDSVNIFGMTDKQF